MLLSMTGYGKGETSVSGAQIRVEIKSLNGKISDLRMRVPTRFKEKEMEIRKLIQEGSMRGKLDVTLTLDGSSSDDDFDLNTKVFKRYLSELRAIEKEEGLHNADLIGAVMRFPNVVQTVDSSLSEAEWADLQDCIRQALQNLDLFRRHEGRAMEKAVIAHLDSIESALEEVGSMDEDRLQLIRSRVQGSLKDYLLTEKIDENRFEQELLYYMEKLDISEEKIRLKQHCHYFSQVLQQEMQVKGKKLSFIAQEMGREINTLGAKAQYSDIQKKVVDMKDDLEKIKEQLANIV